MHTNTNGEIRISKNKKFMLLFIGSFISQFGNVFIHFATGIFILDLTGNAIQMSLYLAVIRVIGLVLQPILGALCDRFNKVKLLSQIDFVSGLIGLIFGGLLFLTNNTTIILIGLYINGIINAGLLAMYSPTYQSVIPAIVDTKELSKAYSMISILGSIEKIAGVLLASFAYMFFGFRYLLIFNAITFIITSIIENFIKVEHTSQRNSPKRRLQLVSEIKEGYLYMSEKKELINMTKVAVLMNVFLVGIMVTSLPFIINTDLQLPPYILASINVSLNLGGLLTAIYMSKNEMKRAGKMISRGFCIHIVIFAVLALSYYGLSRNFINTYTFIGVNICNFFILGCVGSYIKVPLNVSYVKRIEPEYMGRVMSLRSTLASIATPLAISVFGILIDTTGVLVTLVIGWIGITVATIYTLKNKYIRQL